MDFLFSLWEGKERDKGRGTLLSAVSRGGSYPPLRMNYYSEHISTEQMFSNSLFDGTKSPIHAEPVQYRLPVPVLPA